MHLSLPVCALRNYTDVFFFHQGSRKGYDKFVTSFTSNDTSVSMSKLWYCFSGDYMGKQPFALKEHCAAYIVQET